MPTLIISDLKNKLKNPITWFVVIILCTLLSLNILETREEGKTRHFVGHDVVGFSQSSIKLSKILLNDKQKIAYPTVYESMKLYEGINLQAKKAVIEKDYREMTRLTTFRELIILKWDSLSMDPVSDILLKEKIYDMWLDVSDDVSYDSVDFRPIFSKDTKYYDSHLLSAKYHHKLYINDIQPTYNDEVNNVTVIYKYFYSIVPLMLFVVILVFSYSNINREKNNGSLKLILTQSVNRSNFYLTKWISSVIYIFTILLIPPLLISIIMGFLNRFVTLKYPTFYLSNIFTRLKPIPNYFDRVRDTLMIPELYPRVFGHIAPNYHSYTSTPIPHKDIDIIPFYKYLLIVIVLLALFIMFAVALVQLISAIIDNEIISLVVSSVLIGGATYISLPFTQNVSYNLSPFTFFKISRIIEGTYNVTVLTSILVMITSISILLISGCMYFKKKEI